MKSIFIVALSTVCLLSKHSLAYGTDFINNGSTVNNYQNQNNFGQDNVAGIINEIPNNNGPTVNTYSNQNNNFQNKNFQNNNFQNSNFQNNNIQNNGNQYDLNQSYSNQNTNTNNVVNTPINTPYTNNQQTEIPQTSQKAQNATEAIPGSSQKNEGSNATAYLLGGVGFTSVAFIAAFGYKNYRQSAEFNRIRNEFLAGRSNITIPEKAKKSNTLRRLSRSLSLSFVNRDDAFINDKPVVSESVNASNYSLTKNRAYKCHVAWTPLVSDEIILRRGDLVCVKESYNDGYSLGRNLSTKFDGIFPTCCLTTQNEQIMGSELVKNGKFVSVLKRSSSKNKVKRTRRASSVSSVLPSWVQKTELSSILTQ
ncbi:hypothetical protein H8356DRAFT_1733663 [Neocallimastix lanati (nom. inval.)]|jgi:hypothetical protein|uniref:SH3 domain-containing protein n=1 Tax=Neocallimastix californiae TaxID=1754190 RepID=A0A1Y1ZWX9_9FUNG|nr:hypothetical protein H8356DRAFT_1733663 [Neocallimastix sp. JGI-2020a]ORY14714.1 hypothetical protein LY90DRAFT_708573 [Neocallimastix californiae]|eukprot:ORY14714.1 hypothetical protein LY90DRAFT_708573 [Neocallimastix californiae]